MKCVYIFFWDTFYVQSDFQNLHFYTSFGVMSSELQGSNFTVPFLSYVWKCTILYIILDVLTFIIVLCLYHVFYELQIFICWSEVLHVNETVFASYESKDLLLYRSSSWLFICSSSFWRCVVIVVLKWWDESIPEMFDTLQ